MFKGRVRPLDPSFVSSSLYFDFCGLFLFNYMVMKYMVFDFLKVAVIGKMLLQSSGLMKTVAVTKKRGNESGHTHMGVVLTLPIQFSFLLPWLVE